MTDRIVVVTGVSSGIGRATAVALASRGHHVFGSVRRAEHAASLAEELGDRFTPLVFDVTDAAAIDEARAVVAARLGDHRLVALVNSAGIALAGPLLFQGEAEFAQHLAVNVTGPFLVTRAFAPLLGTDPARSGAPGRIVMVSSISGGLATPFLGAYATSKHALEAYADTLRRELMPFGVDVIIVGPGAVATPIWDKGEAAGSAAYAATPYADAFAKFQRWIVANGRKGLPPAVVAATIADAITARAPRARYAVLRGKFAGWTVPRLLPRRVLDRVLAKRTGLLPRG